MTIKLQYVHRHDRGKTELIDIILWDDQDIKGIQYGYRLCLQTISQHDISWTESERWTKDNHRRNQTTP